MSKVRKEMYRCLTCGEEFEADVYDSINVTLDPELKEKVISGNLFMIECPKCGKKEFIQYPTCYHDMDNKFMVYLNGLGQLMDLKEEMNEGPIKDYRKMIGEEIICGSTNYMDFMSNIIALENHLDWRVVKIAMCFLAFSYTNDEKKNGNNAKKMENLGLTIDKDNGEIILIGTVGEGENQESLTCPFPTELYEEMLKAYKPRLDLINPFIFDDESASKFVIDFDEDFKTHEENKTFIYYIELSTEYVELATIKSSLANEIGIGSLVLAENNENQRILGKVKRIVPWNSLAFPVSFKNIFTIVSEFKECHMITTRDSDDLLSNSELDSKLLKIKENSYRYGTNIFPTKLLNNADMFVCSSTTLNMQFDELSKLIHKEIIRGEDLSTKAINKLQKIEIDSKIYLAVYTENDELPKDKEFSNWAFDFNSIVRIVKNDPRYDGIIFNPLGNSVVFDMRIIKDYIKFRTFTIVDEMKKFLDDLNESEIGLIDKQSLQLLRDLYFENLSLGQLAERYKLSEDEATKLIRKGYSELSDIVYAKF